MHCVLSHNGMFQGILARKGKMHYNSILLRIVAYGFRVSVRNRLSDQNLIECICQYKIKYGST